MSQPSLLHPDTPFMTVLLFPVLLSTIFNLIRYSNLPSDLFVHLGPITNVASLTILLTNLLNISLLYSPSLREKFLKEPPPPLPHRRLSVERWLMKSYELGLFWFFGAFICLTDPCSQSVGLLYGAAVSLFHISVFVQVSLVFLLETTVKIARALLFRGIRIGRTALLTALPTTSTADLDLQKLVGFARDFLVRAVQQAVLLPKDMLVVREGTILLFILCTAMCVGLFWLTVVAWYLVVAPCGLILGVLMGRVLQAVGQSVWYVGFHLENMET